MAIAQWVVYLINDLQPGDIAIQASPHAINNLRMSCSSRLKISGRSNLSEDQPTAVATSPSLRPFTGFEDF